MRSSFVSQSKALQPPLHLGIPNIVVHSGYAKDMPKAETFKQNKLFYEDILKVAEKHGITVLTENFNKMFDELITGWILRRICRN